METKTIRKIRWKIYDDVEKKYVGEAIGLEEAEKIRAEYEKKLGRRLALDSTPDNIDIEGHDAFLRISSLYKRTRG